MAEALPVLQAKYLDFKKIQCKPGDSMADVVGRSQGGLRLREANSVPPGPILTATLPGNVLYWRMSSFDPAKGWGDLAAQLPVTGGPVAGLILDLRSNQSPDDYIGAGKVARFFAADPKGPSPGPAAAAMTVPAPPGRTVPILRQPLVVLVNRQTSGSAEVLAASLQRQGALVMGQPTAGRVGIYGELKLTSGQVLLYLAGYINGTDGTKLFGHPVVPDIELTIDEAAEQAALQAIQDNRVTDVLGEAAERHRLNEAALVQGRDPEWDSYVASLDQKNSHFLLTLPELHDTALIAALDSLKAIHVSERPLPPTPVPAGTAPLLVDP